MKTAIWLSALLLCTGYVCADSFPVTNVILVKKAVATRARVILGNVLAIDQITVYRDGSIKMPQYKSAKGTEYQNIEFIDPDVETELLAAIKKGTETVSSFPREKVTFSVTPAELLPKGSKRLANVRVIFNNAVNVTCGVMTGKRGLWIAWPASKIDKQYYNQAYLLDSALKKDVEQRMIESYNLSVQSST
jgi:DNA-binding cell septation regulator SpoVG